MKKYFPSNRALYILIVLYFLVTMTLIILARIFLVDYPIFMLIAVLLFCISFIIVGLIQIPIYFRRTVFFLLNREIGLQTGFFVESKQLMRVSSVQFITKFSLPFGKITGFNFIKINALGGFMVFPFLDFNDAEEIANSIYSSISHDKLDI